MTGIKILATGKCLPKTKVTNDDLSKIVDTSDEWIKKRTGMSVRYHAKEETMLDLAVGAADEAIKKAQRGENLSNATIDQQSENQCNSANLQVEEPTTFDISDIGVVVVATISSDNFTPSTACLLQEPLGLKKDIIAIDVNAACSGFVFGLETMRGLLMSTGAKAGLIVAAEVLSKKMDMTDRGTCVLFGDGAAAAVVTLDDSLCSTITGVESDQEMINCKAPDGKIKMDGQGTYKFAVATVPGLIQDAISKAGLEVADIDHFILHQANLRIIDSIATKLGAPIEKFEINIDKYGNTSAVSVGLVLADANEAGVLKRGDKILICAFGAGKTYGATVFTW